MLLFGVLFTLTAAPASAAERPYESQLTEANGSALSNPFGLSVDGSDNLWVSDTGTFRVSKFDSSGIYQAQNTGSGSWGSSQYIEGLAFSEAAGKVFVSDSNQDDLWGLNLDATYSGTDFHSGLGSGCCFLRVAADNSGGAANGDLYVSGVSGSVVRINSSGAPHNFSASGSHITGNKLTGPFSSPGAVAVGPTGNLYVAGGAKVYVFEPSGTLLEEITEFEGSPLGSIRAIAIDPSNGNVIAASSSTVYEFESSGESLAKITEANGTTFLSIQGLAVDSTGTLYVADGSEHVVDVFGPGIVLPKITNVPVTNQTHTSGTLNASIDLNSGPNVTSCEFQYGPNTGYGSIAPCSPPAPYSGPTSISTDLTGLTPEATYHYRVVLTTANGTAKGADRPSHPMPCLDSPQNLPASSPLPRPRSMHPSWERAKTSTITSSGAAMNLSPTSQPFLRASWCRLPAGFTVSASPSANSNPKPSSITAWSPAMPLAPPSARHKPLARRVATNSRPITAHPDPETASSTSLRMWPSMLPREPFTSPTTVITA